MSTWLSGYLSAYALHTGEPASPVSLKRMARIFAQLEKAYPREEVVRRFTHYLAATPARFYSVERFADTFPMWKYAGGERPVPQRRYQTADEADRRAGIPVRGQP